MNESQFKEFRRTLIGRLLRELGNDFTLRALVGYEGSEYADIRVAHKQVFAALPLAGARLTTLAEDAGITKQSMGALVQELEEMGYLLREKDPLDGRAQIIKFSPKALKMYEASMGITKKIEAQYEALIGKERYARLKDDLKALVEALGIKMNV